MISNHENLDSFEIDCSEFADLMQDAIDDRLPLDSLPELNAHANVCPSCAADLLSWSRIQSVIGDRASRSPAPGEFSGLESVCDAEAGLAVAKPAISRRSAIAVAVCLMLVASLAGGLLPNWETTESNASYAAVAAQAGQPEPVAQEFGESNPAALSSAQASNEALVWFRDVQPEEWIEESMPAVRSLQERVAPLGRSLLQAASILTGTHPSQTS